MARIICIDYGQKRSGIAVTDSLQIIASPLEALLTESLHEYLDKYIKTEDVESLVIGYPTHNDGTKTYLCLQIDEFLKEFEKNHPKIKTFKTEESFSSVEAQNLMRQAVSKKKKRQDKGQLDKFSAVVILRRFLQH